MPHFVILRHTLPPDSPRPSHFDLMLEHDGKLLTWASAALPSATLQAADELPLHRLDYLTYAGPISGDRGEVQRVAVGIFEWLQHDDNTLRVRLTGELMNGEQVDGELVLSRVENTAWSVHLRSLS